MKAEVKIVRVVPEGARERAARDVLEKLMVLSRMDSESYCSAPGIAQSFGLEAEKDYGRIEGPEVPGLMESYIKSGLVERATVRPSIPRATGEKLRTTSIGYRINPARASEVEKLLGKSPS